MFNIGWGELLVIVVIVLFAFGPEDIPKIMYNVGRVVRRFRYMRYALSSQFEDFMEKAEAQGRAKGQIPAMREVNAEDEGEGDADHHLTTMLPTPAGGAGTTSSIATIEPAEGATSDDRSNPAAG